MPPCNAPSQPANTPLDALHTAASTLLALLDQNDANGLENGPSNLKLAYIGLMSAARDAFSYSPGLRALELADPTHPESIRRAVREAMSMLF